MSWETRIRLNKPSNDSFRWSINSSAASVSMATKASPKTHLISSAEITDGNKETPYIAL